MVRRLVLIFFSLSTLTPLCSQNRIQLFTGLGMNYKLAENNVGWNPGINGSFFEFGFTRETAYPISIFGSLELGAAGVSNNLSLVAGVDRFYSAGKGNIEITPGIHVIQGFALFRPNALYMWGLEEENFIAYRFDSGSALGIVLGFRFYAFPGYSDYSSVYRFLDLTMGVRYRFK